jgi:hypothetical protein
MVDLALLQSVSYIAGALGVCVAAAYYVLNMRAQNRNREAQLFINIANQSFNNPEWNAAYKLILRTNWSSAKEFMELNDWPNENEFSRAYAIVAGFFESLGVLVKEDLIDIRMIALLMSSYIEGYYDKLQPYISELRTSYSMPRMLSETEYLYNQFVKYSEKHPEVKT